MGEINNWPKAIPLNEKKKHNGSFRTFDNKENQDSVFVYSNVVRTGKTVWVAFFVHHNGNEAQLFCKGFRRFFGILEPDAETWQNAHRYKDDHAKLLKEYRRIKEPVL